VTAGQIERVTRKRSCVRAGRRLALRPAAALPDWPLACNALAGVGVESARTSKATQVCIDSSSDVNPNGNDFQNERLSEMMFEGRGGKTPHCVIPRNTDAGITKGDVMMLGGVWLVDTVRHRCVASS
jgi:hypothetical protein